jgi:selenocysteine-specific elongation factor
MRSIVVGTAGHIDHGKSSLVRALTGIDPDRLQEEKARGITIDLGFAHVELGDVRVAFVDVPGHERFVRNMLAGATGVDAVLLVVAADESVMPQTREHFDICRLLGVSTGAIALTKCDLADADLRAVARDEVAALVAGSFLDDAPILEVSSQTGEGLDALRDALVRLAARAAGRTSDGPVRLPIDRAFTLRGFGTVVTGTMASGTIAGDAVLELAPSGRAARVRGLHVHGAPAAEVVAGERTAVNLVDVPVADVARGDVLVTPGSFEPSRRLDVRLDLVADAPPLRHGARVRVHHGTAEVMGRVALARVLVPPDAGAPAYLSPRGTAYARIRVETPLVAARGDRFVVRSYSPLRTIGGGVVLDPAPRRGALRTAAAGRRFEALDPGPAGFGDADALGRALAAVAGEARDGVRARDAAKRLGLDPVLVSASGQRLQAAGRLIPVGDRWLDAGVARALCDEAEALVKAHVVAVPDSEGLPREEARDRLRLSTGVLDWVLASLAAEGRVAGRDRLGLPGRHGQLSERDADLAARVESTLEQAGLKVPDEGELAAMLAAAPPDVARVLAWLARQRRVVRVGGLVFHAAVLERLKGEVRALAHGVPPGGTPPAVDVAAFKARYGVSRKYAIPLLEYLDRERVTRRVGDVRVVL